MELTARFRKLACILYWAITVAMLALAVAVVFFYAMPDLARETLMANAPRGLAIQSEPSTPAVYGLLLLGTVSVAVQLFIMWQMRALFDLYADGHALSAACGVRISRMGIGLLIFPLTGILYHAGSSVLLTLSNPIGQRQLSIGIGSPELAAMAGGGMLLLVGAAMSEASRQAEENRSFV